MHKWSNPKVSLNAITIDGNGPSGDETGNVIDLLEVKSYHAVQVNISTTENVTLQIHLQGSLDNENWYTLLDSSGGIVGFDSSLSSGTYSETVSVTAEQPAAYLRVTGYASTGSCTVTAYVLSR